MIWASVIERKSVIIMQRSLFLSFTSSSLKMHISSTPLLSLLMMVIGYSSIPPRPCISISCRLFVTKSNARDSFSQDTMLYHVIAICHVMLCYSTVQEYFIASMIYFLDVLKVLCGVVWCGVVCFLSSHFINLTERRC